MLDSGFRYHRLIYRMHVAQKRTPGRHIQIRPPGTITSFASLKPPASGKRKLEAKS